MYAVIEDSGTQIKVEEGDVIKVDRRDLADDAVETTFDRVMLIGGGEGKPRIGKPYVEGASVSADIVEEGRDGKIMVVKFKRRKDYKRVRGHRQPYVKVQITSING